MAVVEMFSVLNAVLLSFRAQRRISRAALAESHSDERVQFFETSFAALRMTSPEINH
jgi:hypothetical protein